MKNTQGILSKTKIKNDYEITLKMAFNVNSDIVEIWPDRSQTTYVRNIFR